MAEETVESLQELLARKDARITELNAESARHRHEAKEANRKLEAVTGERDAFSAQVAELRPKAESAAALERQVTESTAARTTAEANAAAAQAAVKKVTTQASLKVAAVAAGIINLSDLALVDEGKLELTEAGELKDGKAFMETFKAERPYLFGAVGQTQPARDLGTTVVVPPTTAPATRDTVLALDDKGMEAALRDRPWRK